MYVKQLIVVVIYMVALNNANNAAGQDTIPPKIIIDETQIRANYPLGDLGLDVNPTFLSDDTLEVTLSCIYLYPKNYYFKIENAVIEDDSGIFKDTIIVNDIIFNENGYGTVIQTITAEDNAGNTSKFVVITKFIGFEYRFDILGMRVGGIETAYDDNTFTLENTDFEFCNVQKVNVVMLYSKNGCTGGTRIDWYINNERVKTDSDEISIDFSKESYGIELSAEAKYSNSNFQDRIRINIQKNILDFALSDTIIDLSKNETLTIRNLSNLTGEYSWQLGDSSFINNETEFEYGFNSPGNYEIKLSINNGICSETISRNILVEGTVPVLDTIPPVINIDDSQIVTNYFKGNGFDGSRNRLSGNQLEIELSCIYSFPEDYYFKLENVTFNDDSGILKDTLIVNYISKDDEGYGSVSQTVIAEDIYGNTSKFEIISKFSGTEYKFDFREMIVGGNIVPYNESTNTLETTDFEFCKGQNIEVKAFYSKNGCTGNTRIDWYKNNELISTNSDGVLVNIGNESGEIELAAEGKYSNTNFNDRIKIKLRQKIANYSNLVINNPTCLNSGDGSISLESIVENVIWEHNNSNALKLTSLNSGSYYVSYSYDGCNVNDTITLVPKNFLDFVVSDTVIDLTQNEILTIHNLSKGFDKFWWQIGDSILPTNTKDDVIKYKFTTPGDYEIRLSEQNVNCDMAIKKVKVIGTTSSLNYSIASVKIGPNPFKDFINIDFAKSFDYNLKIYGVDGRVYLIDKVFNKSRIQLDLRFLIPGVYILNIAPVNKYEQFKDFKIVKLTGD